MNQIYYDIYLKCYKPPGRQTKLIHYNRWIYCAVPYVNIPKSSTFHANLISCFLLCYKSLLSRCTTNISCLFWYSLTLTLLVLPLPTVFTPSQKWSFKNADERGSASDSWLQLTWKLSRIIYIFPTKRNVSYFKDCWN